MDKTEELKDAVEELSEEEFRRLQLLRTIVNIATEMDTEELNQLPSLYRIEIKKALRESGNQQRADQIRT